MNSRENIIDEIELERIRQVQKEGWTEAHDDEHDSGEMAMAAACYADPRNLLVWQEAESFAFSGNDGGRGDRQLLKAGYYTAWPWSDEWDKREKHDQRRRLIIAGALIVAEIERLDRAEASPDAQPE